MRACIARSTSSLDVGTVSFRWILPFWYFCFLLGNNVRLALSPKRKQNYQKCDIHGKLTIPTSTFLQRTGVLEYSNIKQKIFHFVQPCMLVSPRQSHELAQLDIPVRSDKQTSEDHSCIFVFFVLSIVKITDYYSSRSPSKFFIWLPFCSSFIDGLPFRQHFAKHFLY